MLDVEARDSATKRQCLDQESQEDNTGEHFTALAGLHVHDSPQTQEGPEVQGNVNALQDKIKELDKALQNVTDMI
eukprot:9970157-Ditylum_brightwellii.AAC.1